MAIAEYDRYDALGLAQLVKQGDVTPVELTEEAIARIERHNPKINAVIFKAYDEARATAKSKLPGGPFRGVPFVIKDIGVSVAGWPTTSGSAFTRDFVPKADSELIKRYRAAGLVFVGKTNTPELGITGTTESRHLGPCRNPWNTDHISGGSSGGTAAAVAAGILPMAHGSDGLGSIRIPAACCGLFGMKVTQYRNPGGPDDRNRAHGLVVDHVLTRTVRDSAAMLDWTGRPEDDAPYAPPPKARPYMEEIETKPGKLRIACSTQTPLGIAPHEDVRKVFEETVKLLESLGHEVFAHDLSIDYRKLYRAQGWLSAAMMAASIDYASETLGRKPKDDELEPLTWAGYHAGRALTGEQVGWALQTLRIMTREILGHWRKFDAMLMPVTIAPPPRIGHIDPVNLEPKEVNRRQARVFGYTPPFNLTGQPSMSVPLGMSSDKLPIGMMFTGRYGDEGTLYRLAAQLEQARPWIGRRPPVWG